MKPAEIEVKISIAQKEADYWRGILSSKRCGSCTQWHQEMCQKYQAAPPAEVRATGCDEWTWDGIPF
jgi:hypothetical protein